MGMFGPKKGSWWIKSASDPRWNADGRSYVGMFSMPPEAKRKIEKLKKKLGEEPPEDLEWGYFKD